MCFAQTENPITVPIDGCMIFLFHVNISLSIFFDGFQCTDNNQTNTDGSRCTDNNRDNKKRPAHYCSEQVLNNSCKLYVTNYFAKRPYLRIVANQSAPVFEKLMSLPSDYHFPDLPNARHFRKTHCLLRIVTYHACIVPSPRYFVKVVNNSCEICTTFPTYKTLMSFARTAFYCSFCITVKYLIL